MGSRFGLAVESKRPFPEFHVSYELVDIGDTELFANAGSIGAYGRGVDSQTASRLRRGEPQSRSAQDGDFFLGETMGQQEIGRASCRERV